MIPAAMAMRYRPAKAAKPMAACGGKQHVQDARRAQQVRAGHRDLRERYRGLGTGITIRR